jgi:small subunit ribosomal protein S4e
MGGKGNGRYLKRLNSPEFMGIHRKEYAYITKPSAGRHSLERCIALSLAARKLGVADTTDEANRAIRAKSFKVNGKIVTEPKYPIGIGDILETGSDTFKLWINEQGKITFEQSKSKDPLYKVVGKYKDKANKMMLRLHDGSVMAAKSNISVNDSVVIKGGKIEKTIKLAPGAKCSVVDGVHVGAQGTVVNLVEGTMHKSRSLVIESGSSKFETLVRNIMVTG